MKKVIMVTLLALLAATSSFAQSPFSTVRGYVFAPGADPSTATPVYTFSVGPSSMVCGQTPVTIPSPGVNVSTAYWTDPTNSTKQCRAAIVAINSTNPSTPVGSYDLYMTGTVSGSAEGPKNGPFALQVTLPPSPQIQGVGAKDDSSGQ